MYSFYPTRLLVLVLVGASPAVVAQTHGAHVHGVSELAVAVEGKTVLLQLEAPLSNIVGFEHAPRTDAQKQRVKEAVIRLLDAEGMFSFPERAACEPAGVEVEGPHYIMEHIESADERHDDDHDRTGHEHGEKHAEVEVTYSFECLRTSELNTIEARFLDAFVGTEAVRTTVITPSTSSYVELKRGNHVIPID